MIQDNKLLSEFHDLPEEEQNQVIDFIAFLKSKAQSKKEIKQRRFGVLDGKVWMSEDFDEPLEEFTEYM
tara:strand:+ start:183 stop:389 length:207 start_codon:yes stop_codon:yes gene_type:complete